MARCCLERTRCRTSNQCCIPRLNVTIQDCSTHLPVGINPSLRMQSTCPQQQLHHRWSQPKNPRHRAGHLRCGACHLEPAASLRVLKTGIGGGMNGAARIMPLIVGLRGEPGDECLELYPAGPRYAGQLETRRAES